MFKSVRRQPRLFAAAGLGIVIGFCLPGDWSETLRMIVGWDVAAGLYLLLAGIMMVRADVGHIQAHARSDDERQWVILLMCALAATTSLGAIVSLLGDYKDLPEVDKAPHLALGVLTILVSWFFLHMVFAVHYAHEFYGDTMENGKARDRGGFEFPGKAKTWTYMDFAYYSFTIGMTAQTSDIAVTTTAMRRLTLAHAILTFFFNTVIVAFSVNIAASLL
jgi:uncharacterized membrane protein